MKIDQWWPIEKTVKTMMTHRWLHRIDSIDLIVDGSIAIH